MVKICSKCKEEKTIDEFYVILGKVYSKCKSCQKKAVLPTKNKFALKQYPAVTQNCVYAFKDGDEIVYIGESDRVSYRIWEHLNQKSITSKSFCKELNVLERKKRFTWHILWYGDEGQDSYRLYQEKELIKLHQPKYNKTWVKES